MDNEKNNDFKPTETDPVTGKRKVVLGQEDFSTEDNSNQISDPGTDRSDKPAKGFLSRFLNRDSLDEPVHDGEQLTQEASDVIRAQNQGYNRSPLFDEERDRLVAEESTKNVPADLLQTKIEPHNPAARMVEEAQIAAVAAERDGLTRQDRVPLTDRERRDRRVKNRWIGGAIFVAIAALVIYFAPALQELIFKTKGDSLIFSSAEGLLGPRAGIISMLLGLLGLGILFSTMFTKRKEETLSKKQVTVKKRNPFRTIGLVMLILIPLGFVVLFNFTEFRNSDIRYSSLFNQNLLVSYDKVSDQQIKASGNEIVYTIKTDKGTTSFNITKLPLESVKLLDNKLPKSRNVNLDTEVIQKLVDEKIYTNDEILRLFINK